MLLLGYRDVANYCKFEFLEHRIQMMDNFIFIFLIHVCVQNMTGRWERGSGCGTHT